MADSLKSVAGQASIAGALIYTVPAGGTATIVGLRASNADAGVNHTFHVEVNGTKVSGLATPLPAGSAIDIMSGAKIVANANDTVIAYADANLVIDIHLSFLEQV